MTGAFAENARQIFRPVVRSALITFHGTSGNPEQSVAGFFGSLVDSLNAVINILNSCNLQSHFCSRDLPLS